MAGSNFDLTEEEASYAAEAIHAINLRAASHILNNTYKLHESCALHRSLLDNNSLPLLWRSILNMSLATLDPSSWKMYIEQAVVAWNEPGREPGGEMWEVLGKMLRRVARDVESGARTGGRSRQGSASSHERGSLESEGRREADEVLAHGDILAMAFEFLCVQKDGPVLEDMDGII